MTALKRIPIWAWSLLLVLIPFAISIAGKWLALPVTDGTIIGTADPDPWLRLTLVREWLQGGSWYSHVVTHSNVPFSGISSPWTRPLDVVIAFFTQLQPDSVDINLRLIRAALLLPMLWMGLLLLGLYRAMRILCPLTSGPFMISVLVASCLPMWNYMSSGNADHHAMLAVLFVWALGGVLIASPKPAPIIVSGLLFALQLWISPEAMIIIAIIYAWYAYTWLISDVRAEAWKLLATTIAFGSAIALMIERPPAEWFVPVYDSISIVYVAILSLVAGALWLMMWRGPHRFLVRFVRGGVWLGFIAIILNHFFPLLRKGPMAEVDPYILSDFLPRIVEAQPLYTAQPLHIVAMLVQPAIAVFVLRRMWDRHPGVLKPMHLSQLAFLLITFGALYISQQRFYYYLYPIVVLILAPVFAALFTPGDKNVWPTRWILSFTPNQQALRRLPLLITVIALPLALLAMKPKQDTEQSSAINSCQTAARRLIHSGELATLNNGRPLNLFTSTDLGGEVLFFTPYSIVASNYHREGSGIRYVWEADKITDLKKLRTYLAERKINALLLCPVVKSPENSALQRLREGKLGAAWLKSVAYVLPAPAGASADEMTHKPALFLVK